MRDTLVAAIRTGVQAIIGLLVGVPFIASLDIATEVEAILMAVAVAVVTLVLNFLEKKLPWLTPILSLGATKSTATY